MPHHLPLKTASSFAVLLAIASIASAGNGSAGNHGSGPGNNHHQHHVQLHHHNFHHGHKYHGGYYYVKPYYYYAYPWSYPFYNTYRQPVAASQPQTSTIVFNPTVSSQSSPAIIPTTARATTPAITNVSRADQLDVLQDAVEQIPSGGIIRLRPQDPSLKPHKVVMRIGKHAREMEVIRQDEEGVVVEIPTLRSRKTLDATIEIFATPRRKDSVIAVRVTPAE